MFLFKKPILEYYNILHYTNDGFLLLHCSRNDVVHAPFDGKVEATQDGCILSNDEFQLYICHMVCDKEQKVKAGDKIGTPIITKNMAYIGIKIYKDGEYKEPLTYLEYKDESYKENKKEDKTETKEVETEIKSKPKKKSNNKYK